MSEKEIKIIPILVKVRTERKELLERMGINRISKASMNYKLEEKRKTGSHRKRWIKTSTGL